MGQVKHPRGLLCPGCGTPLEPAGAAARPPDPDARAMVCPSCGETFRARRRVPGSASDPGVTPAGPPPVGPFALFWRGAALQGLEWAYRGGVCLGSAALFVCGGFVPVTRGWLRDEIEDRAGFLAALGGVRVVTETKDPDADLGPVLDRTDAPLLFSAVSEVAKRLNVKPPGQIRLTYLPACGVVAWGRSHALILGLPLLRVLTLAEMRAVIAHELAHLARGDATRAAKSVRFVEGLRQALDHAGERARGPLGVWARSCFRAAGWLIGPVAWGQETRADRSAALIAGGSTAASALVKVAVVQPLFREVLEHYDPDRPEAPNLYAFFRAFWYRLPAEVHTAMRLRILADPSGPVDPAHPPLPDRIARLQSYPELPSSNGSTHSSADVAPATSCLGDLEAFEQMLHNRLFGLPPIEPSVFHRAGS
ncbi:MAG: M48 family metallopeptidase [Isosphaeraceae bacterium]